MACLIPQISIHLAPVEDIPEEPRSPFSPSSWTVTPDSGNSFRPQHLSPISAGSPSFAKVLSPLRPLDSPIKGAGLERQRFEAMLKASKERSSATGARKAADLRKAIALKAHNSKQGKLCYHLTKCMSRLRRCCTQLSAVRSSCPNCKRPPPRQLRPPPRLLLSPHRSSTTPSPPPALIHLCHCSTRYQVPA